MQAGSCIESLASAVYRAVLVDLPDVSYRNFTPHMKKEGKTLADAPMAERRPREEECEVFHFPQTWGSTALGFGGIGGQAITSAYTTVVVKGTSAAVYFAGRHAYTLNGFNTTFMVDVYNQTIVERQKVARYMK